MSSSLFYQKYRRLFFEDDEEPMAYQIYHNTPSRSSASELPHWLSQQVQEPLPKLPSKVRLPPIEYSPPTVSRKVDHSPPAVPRKVEYSPPRKTELATKPRQLTPLHAALEGLDQPRRQMLQYEPMSYEPLKEEPKTEKINEYVPKPSIKIVGKTEDTRERVFPKGAGVTTSLNPYQTAVQRRKEARKSVDGRREALRKLINAGWQR